MATRQNQLGLRLTELTARFKAGADAEAPAEADAKQKRMFEMAKRAVVPLGEAEKHVAEATTALSGKELENAMERQQEALLAMFRAMELFSEIKGLVELTHKTQLELVSLLSPEAASNKALSTKDRAKRLSEQATRNLDRLARLKGMFEDEVAGIEAQAAQAAQGAQGQAGPPQGQAPSPEQIEQQKQLYAQAEVLRAQAELKVGELSAIIDGKSRGDALLAAQEGEASLKELRRLFFNVVEHLEELIAEQEQTRDSTAQAQGLPDDKRLEKFGPLVDRQSRHAAAGDAIEKALAEMADQAAQNPQPQAQGGKPPPKFAEAAEEMRNANPPLAGARDELNSSRESAQTSSVSLEPTMELQDKALEHLRAALALLKPPKQDKNQDQDQDQDKQDQKKQEDEVTQQQAQQRLQEAREREAERRRKKKQQQPSGNEVEKDW